MDNQQQKQLTLEEKQLLISLYLGDGCFIKSNHNDNYCVVTSCVHIDLLEFKKSLVTTLDNSEITYENNSKGYNKKGIIHKWRINMNKEITTIANLSLEEKLENLNELGVALWFYDDGSLHKSKDFYNLCTHAFTFEQNEKIIESLKRFNIFGTMTKETKKDGRTFWYIRVGKFSGAWEISELLKKYFVKSMQYKCLCSETSHIWRTLQVKWKREEPESEFKSFYRKKSRFVVKI